MDFTSHPSRLLCSCVWTFFCELERTHEFAVISGCFQRWRKHGSQSLIRCTKPLDPVTNRIEEYLTRATPKRAAGTHLNFELLAGSLSWLSWLRFSYKSVLLVLLIILIFRKKTCPGHQKYWEFCYWVWGWWISQHATLAKPWDTASESLMFGWHGWFAKNFKRLHV